MSWLVKDRLLPDRVTAGATPVPESEILCGLPDASSVIDTAPFRVLVAVGSKVTLIVQFAPAATLEPQVLVCAKSPLFAPVMAMLVMFSVALPLLVRLTTCAVLLMPTNWLPKSRPVPPRATTGPTPEPLSDTVCGLFAASSVTVTDPVLVPGAVGAKVTLIAHCFPAASELPQVLVSAKSPLEETPTMFNAALFLSLVKVMVCGALVLPIACVANVKAFGDK